METLEKLEFLSVLVSDTRNKVVKQHTAGKILAMHCMSFLLKMFNFIVKRLLSQVKIVGFLWFVLLVFFL